MALTNYSQTPLLAFYQSALLAFGQGDEYRTNRIIKSQSRRKILYNVEYFDITDGSITGGTSKTALAIPITFSPSLPSGQWYLSNTVNLDVVWGFTVSGNRLTNPIPIIKIPYQIDDKDCWDANSYVIKGNKVYSDWEGDRDAYQVGTSHGVPQYWVDNTFGFKGKIYRGTYPVYVSGSYYYEMYKDFFGSGFYYALGNVDSNFNEISPVDVSSWPHVTDRSISIVEDLGLPYAKITSSFWIMNAISLAGIYIFDPSNLTTFDPTSQNYVGNDGTRDWYLKFYEEPVLCYNKYLSGWILSPWASLPHETPADWIGKSIYVYEGSAASFIGSYKTYSVQELSGYGWTALPSDYLDPTGHEICSAISLPSEPFAKGIKRQVTLKYKKDISCPTLLTDDPSTVDSSYYEITLGSCFYNNYIYDGNSSSEANTSGCKRITNYNQGWVSKLDLKVFYGNYAAIEGDDIGWQGPGVYSYVRENYYYYDYSGACPPSPECDFYQKTVSVSVFTADSPYRPCYVDASGLLIRTHKFTAYYGPAQEMSCNYNDPNITWQGAGLYCWSGTWKYFDRLVTVEDCDAMDYVEITTQVGSSYIATESQLACRILRQFSPATLTYYTQGPTGTFYNLVLQSSTTKAEELAKTQEIYVIGEELHE